MTILSLTTDVAGQIDVHPRRVKMITTDALSPVTTAGYLNSKNLMGEAIYPTDIFDCFYSFNKATGTGTYSEFLVTII